MIKKLTMKRKYIRKTMGKNNKKRTTKKNKLTKKKTKKNIKGGYQVVMYRMYDMDDDTIKNKKGRCMCVDYKLDNNGRFSVKHNQNLHRCNHQKAPGSDFCNKHTQCRGYIRNFLSGYEPQNNKKELDYWKHPYIEGSHNCYSYFLNDRIPSVKEKCHVECLKKNKSGCPKKIDSCRSFIPQPGDFDLIRKYGDLKKKKRVYTCPNMEKKISSDNPTLFKVDFNQRCPKNYYKGSMVVDTNHTFHFYRQNSDGTWSHKPGTLPVTDKDANEKTIYIPHFSNRNYTEKGDKNDEDAINYNDFCGYYCIPSSDYSAKDSI